MRKFLIAALAVALTGAFVAPAQAGPLKNLHKAKMNLIKNVDNRSTH